MKPTYLNKKNMGELVVVVISSCQAKTLDITSPDGNLKVTVELAEEKGYGEIGFQWITRVKLCFLNQSWGWKQMYRS